MTTTTHARTRSDVVSLATLDVDVGAMRTLLESFAFSAAEKQRLLPTLDNDRWQKTVAAPRPADAHACQADQCARAPG